MLWIMLSVLFWLCVLGLLFRALMAAEDGIRGIGGGDGVRCGPPPYSDQERYELRRYSGLPMPDHVRERINRARAAAPKPVPFRLNRPADLVAEWRSIPRGAKIAVGAAAGVCLMFTGVAMVLGY